MFTLTRPDDATLRARLAAQAALSFSYPEVSGTEAIDDLAAQPWAQAYVIDDNRVQVGHGSAAYAAACDALRQWAMFDLGWVTAFPTDTPIAEGAVVGVLARAFGLWSFNACRIIYTIDEPGPGATFGFGYGTLPDHAARGEERFVVYHNPQDDSVWYRVTAFSQPQHWLARAGYPLIRRLQRRFAQGSLTAMRAATQAEG